MLKKSKKISIEAVETRIFQQGENLTNFLLQHLSKDSLEDAILCITSKIVSLAENRVVDKHSTDKVSLVKKEADHFLAEGPHGVQLTITRGLLIPSAGIDESNSATGGFILYPENPYAQAAEIYAALKEHFKITNFGVILTDSRSTPLRQGVNGVALAHWGFAGTNSLVGEKDIFSKPLKFTHVNVADAIASMGVFCMGEGAEITPLAIVRGADVKFRMVSKKEEVQILPENDLYFPLLKPWLQKD